MVVSVCKHRSLQSVRNIFIVSLSCSDIVVCIVSGSVTPITAFSKIWLFGSTLCNLVPLIQVRLEGIGFRVGNKVGGKLKSSGGGYNEFPYPPLSSNYHSLGFQGTSLCFSTLTLTAISIDRFILIIFPTKK